MLEIASYFTPVDKQNLDIDIRYSSNKATFYQIDRYTDNHKLLSYDIALFGVEEERNTNNKGTKLAPNEIRKQLYKLINDTNLKIVDLGNIKVGKSLKDTYIALGDIVYELVSNNILPIIIGGGQDLSYAIYLGLDKFNKSLNLVSIDSKIDLGYDKNNFDAESYLGQIILEKGKNLFNYSNLGHQSYFCEASELSLLKEMRFDAFRLGYLRSHIEEAEPVLRDADILSLDMNSIKQSDSPANINPSPNGFYSDEICQLARYAGISDRLKCFGLFELNPKFDIHEQSASLAAQIIWYFIAGFSARENETPNLKDKRYSQHIVSLDKTEHNIVFYKNTYNCRWWIEVPYPQKKDKHILVACTENDYNLATRQEIPDRWLNTVHRLI